MKISVMLIIISLLLVGCATPNTFYQTGYGIQYHQYEINIISEPPGAKIEWNNEYIGEAPIARIMNGHMGVLAGQIVVKALPSEEGQYTQTKLLKCNFRIPKVIYFDMRLKPVPSEYNINLKKE